jgi:hypothetical protein
MDSSDSFKQTREEILNILVISNFCRTDKPATALEFETQKERAINEFKNDVLLNSFTKQQLSLIMTVIYKNFRGY